MTERSVTRRRWPRSVYDVGEEPDCRFSFANERTFLAWIRTALGLLGAGLALSALDVGLPEPAGHVIAMTVIAIALLCAMTAWFRWAAAEKALRQSLPLPGSRAVAMLTGGLVVAAVVLIAALL